MAVRERDCLDCKWERTMASGCWWLGRCCCHVGWGTSACVVSIPVGGWRRGEAVVRRVWCYCEERGCWIWRRKLGIWERLFCMFGFFFFSFDYMCFEGRLWVGKGSGIWEVEGESQCVGLLLASMELWRCYWRRLFERLLLAKARISGGCVQRGCFYFGVFVVILQKKIMAIL